MFTGPCVASRPSEIKLNAPFLISLPSRGSSILYRIGFVIVTTMVSNCVATPPDFARRRDEFKTSAGGAFCQLFSTCECEATVCAPPVGARVG